MPKDTAFGLFLEGCERKAGPACQAARQGADAKAFFESQFVPYIVEEPAFYTGYYTPAIDGSSVPTDVFRYPVYARPKDLGKTPYLTRSEIDGGALRGKGLELAWVADPIALFFMHVQGSGQVMLQDQGGRQMTVAMNGTNNQPYQSIGKLLADQGMISRPEVTMESISAWLRAHPEQMWQVLHANPRYVFFGVAESPKTTLGVAPVASTTLAVDRRYVVLNTPVIAETELPNGHHFNSLLMAQDTGSAIIGPGRGDIYFGSGTEIGRFAGDMKHSGRMILLLPKTSSPADKMTFGPNG